MSNQSGGSVAVFLQVRLDSSRLPAKALYELAGKPVVVHCMEALRDLRADRYCLLTDGASASILSPFARACGFSVFSGPKDDVLSRFVMAADHFGIDHILRGTADNPLVSHELSSLVQDSYLTSAADYCVLKDVPHGSCIEAVSAHALRIVRTESTDAFEHEHVCPGIYRQAERFRVLYIEPPLPLRRPEIRVTIDNIEDYEIMRRLFQANYHSAPIKLAAAIEFLAAAGKEN